MTPVILLSSLALVPVVVLMVLRVNAALVFLSLCLGSVLTTFLGPDTNSLLSLLSAHASTTISASQSTAQLVLLAIPVVITTLFMIRSVPKGFKLLLNLLPASGVGLLAVLLSVPLLPSTTARGIIMTGLWQEAVKAQDLIVGISALVCLFAILGLRPKGEGHSEKHGKKYKD
jgi:hypothetical protein